MAWQLCSRPSLIGEASQLRDKAAALQAYARQRDDRDLEVWTAEIKLRASVRIGELVRVLDKAPNQHARPANGTSKREAIRDAGLSKSTANRYEGLAGL